MRLIIHAGMHKTGSSSIQETFRHLNREKIRYTPFRSANHSGLFAFLTHPSIETYHGFAMRGFTREALLKDRAYWTESFQSFLSSLNETAIFSAEDISVAEPSQLELFRDLLSESSITPDIIIYVRPPISYMQSAFQERLKGGICPLFTSQLWPSYRQRVDHLDNTFGRENVTVRPFHPWEFPGNSVVKDFASYAGVSLSENEIKYDNQSLYAEAISLLYLQRKLGNGLAGKSEKAIKQNARWISALQDIGTHSLNFGIGITEPILSKNRNDLLWIEKRMGRKLEDKIQNQGFTIESEKDLLTLAEKQLVPLTNTIKKRIDELEPSPRTQLVQVLESLRALY